VHYFKFVIATFNYLSYRPPLIFVNFISFNDFQIIPEFTFTNLSYMYKHIPWIVLPVFCLAPKLYEPKYNALVSQQHLISDTLMMSSTKIYKNVIKYYIPNGRFSFSDNILHLNIWFLYHRGTWLYKILFKI